MYQEEDFFPLSGLQHFAFCRRQWALIHIEQQWAENLRTVQGNILHEKAHNPDSRELRGDVLITRGMKIHSFELGMAGECDVVEFHRAARGISLPNREGLWQPYPVEYKRGSPKDADVDRLQLCAQAICIEQMLCCEVSEGALYYGEIRRRESVIFSDDLRHRVSACLQEMHELYRRKYTPKVKPGKWCNACSLRELCLPKLNRKKNVADYLRVQMEDEP